MSDDLKKRLIDWDVWVAGDINDTREEAHAYIEELEAKLSKSKHLEANLSKSEALLAKAVDVIDWALICWDDHNTHGHMMQGDWVLDARATLAELKGKGDE